MSFKEAGAPPEKRGIHLDWSYILDDRCPACGDELVYFDRFYLWKCGCGFKISDNKKDTMYDKVCDDPENYQTNGGFNMGNWTDEPPF